MNTNVINAASSKGVMEAENKFKHGAGLKSRRGKLVNTGFFLLMFFLLLTGCSKPTPIDISNNNLEEYVSIEVNKHLDRAVKYTVIIQYQQEPIHTSIESFKVIVQEYVADGATLHPNLTYKINYLGGTSGKECEAMAYSIVRNGKLYGSGVVVSEAISRAWAKTWVMGDYSKDTGVNWPVWIGFILLMIMSPSIIRFLSRIR